MLIAIAHNAVPDNAREDERDVLVQVEAVQQSLDELGYRYERLPVSLNLATIENTIRLMRPDLVFNLVESLADSDRFASIAVGLFEKLGVCVTGSDSSVLWVSNQKTLAKRQMLMAGLPTAPWYETSHANAAIRRFPMTGPLVEFNAGNSYIIKPVFEHASRGMDQAAIVAPQSEMELEEILRQRSAELGCICFAERYIDGREFNVSLLTSASGCQVLPLAETDFSDFPEGMPRIVDYDAKWNDRSFGYHHTPRKFLDPASDPSLATEIARLASASWEAFDVQGHVRVDFRVDNAGQPWILEINTNPCLSPDAGFAAALKHTGIRIPEAVERIIQAAMHPDRLSKSVHADSDRQRLGPAGLSLDRAELPVSAEIPPTVPNITWRYEVRSDDPDAIRKLVAATEFFYPDEVEVAEELAVERLEKGESSGYYFVFADQAGQVQGYACYGPIACTRHSYDLYWIAVDPRAQGHGMGRQILIRAEERIAAMGGKRVYIETSNRPQYLSTRAFYDRCGYRCEATLTEYYGPGDDKVIYVKELGELAQTG